MKYILILFALWANFALAASGSIDIGSGGSSLPSQSSHSGEFLTTDGSTASWAAGSGTGTVTSVDMTVPTGFAISGNPVTTSGTLALTLSTETTNKVFAAPNGSTGVPTFRALVGADLPNPSSSTLGGVQSIASASHNFLTTISTSGVPSKAQPACADISDATSACSTSIASANTASNIVVRDGSGNFSAGTVTATLTGRVNSTQVVETVVAGGTCSTTYTVDPTTGTMFNVTLNGACNFAVTNLAAGHSFTIKMTQSSTTAPTFSSAYGWTNGTQPTFSTSATKYDYIACISTDGTTLGCSGIVDVRH